MKGKVLITGGAGFIGSHTADLLLKKGYQVRILDNLNRQTHHGTWPVYLDKRIDKIKGDVRCKKHWLKALKGVDYVIHLAAWMDYPEVSKFASVNTVGTANLYQLIVTHQLPIKKVIVASSQFVYGQGRWRCPKHGIVFPQDRPESRLKKGLWDPLCPLCRGPIKPLPHLETHQDPQNPYALTKYTQELIALRLGKLYNIPSVALRYSIVHGSRQSFKNTYSGALRQFYLWLKAGDTITVYEDGKQLRDFVSVYDVAQANLLVLEKKAADYQVFNVGGDHSYTVVQLAKMVSKTLDKKIKINFSGFYRAGDTRHSFSNINKLKKLGWKPTRTAQENINDFVAWAQKQDLDGISVDQTQKKLQQTGVLRSSSH